MASQVHLVYAGPPGEARVGPLLTTCQTHTPRAPPGCGVVSARAQIRSAVCVAADGTRVQCSGGITSGRCTTPWMARVVPRVSTRLAAGGHQRPLHAFWGSSGSQAPVVRRAGPVCSVRLQLRPLHALTPVHGALGCTRARNTTEQRVSLKPTAMAPLSSLLQEACGKFKPALDPATSGLLFNKKPLDLGMPWRLANIPSGSRLDVVRGGWPERIGECGAGCRCRVMMKGRVQRAGAVGAQGGGQNAREGGGGTGCGEVRGACGIASVRRPLGLGGPVVNHGSNCVCIYRLRPC